MVYENAPCWKCCLMVDETVHKVWWQCKWRSMKMLLDENDSVWNCRLLKMKMMIVENVSKRPWKWYFTIDKMIYWELDLECKSRVAENEKNIFVKDGRIILVNYLETNSQSDLY